MIKKQTTKDLLAESLRELTEQMPFERISVREICQNCSLSSTTFYKHFRDKYDLVEWIYRMESGNFVERITDSYTWKDAALDTIRAFRENLEYYRSYFRSNSSAENLHMITCAEAFDTIRKLHGDECLTDEVRFILELYITGVTRKTVEWIMDRNTKVTPEELAEMLMTAMPEKIKVLLF